MNGRGFGLMIAFAIATMAVIGAVLLVALDFAEAGDGAGAPSEGEQLTQKLKHVSNINLFVVTEVPGSALKVRTGSEYPDAAALAAGRPSLRWCYVEPPEARSSVTAKVELGRQQGDETPVFLKPASISAEEARLFGVTPDALLSLAQRHCRFGG